MLDPATITAVQPGQLIYCCTACHQTVSGSFPDAWYGVEARGLCRSCERDFYGVFDPRNFVMGEVLKASFEKKSPRRSVLARRMGATCTVAKETYMTEARRMAAANYRKHKDLLNPHDLPVGPYELDHTIPLNVCWDYFIEPKLASDVVNLRMIPRLVNNLRGGRINLKKLIDLPFEYAVKLNDEEITEQCRISSDLGRGEI